MPPAEKLAGNEPPALALNLTEWHRLLNRAKLRSDAEVADKLGTSRQAVWRVQCGQRAPSATFVAVVLDRLPGAKFDRLFRVVAGAAS